MGQRYLFSEEPLPHRPFLIKDHETVSPGLENEYLRALRTDGARVTKTLPTGKHATGREAWNIDLPADYKTVVIADAVGMKSTFYSPRHLPSHAGSTTAKPNCEGRLQGYVAGPEATHLGHRVLPFTSRTKVGDTWQETVHWLAPALNCESVNHQIRTITPTGVLLSTFERTAVAIEIGEPPHDLFTIPPAYAEVPPSVASIALHEKTTGRPFGNSPNDAKLRPGLERMDQKYSAGLAHRP